MSDINKQLASFAKKLNEEYAELALVDDIADTTTLVESINDLCLKILDHALNHFSLIKDKYHFPRPNVKGVTAYKKIISNHIRVSKNLGNSNLINFLNKCLPIVKKYHYDIRFLDGGQKHSFVKAPQINQKFRKQDITYNVIGEQPKQTNRGLNIPGVGLFGKGSNIHMEHCVSIGPGYVSIIEKLDSVPIFISGKYIFFEINGIKIKKYLRKWLRNCIDTCGEILIHLKE